MTEITLTSHVETHKVFLSWAQVNEQTAIQYAMGIASDEDVQYFLAQSDKFVAALNSERENYVWDGDEPQYVQQDCEAEMAAIVSTTVAEVRNLLANRVVPESDDVLDAEFRALLAELGINFDREPAEDDDL